jgi:predicted O-methyltransferase YrrM
MTIAKRLVRKFNNLIGRSRFKHSSEYWNQRYLSGGTSGPGSYNRLAKFKAEFLNNFVRSNNVRTIIEFGSGDGAQLELADYPNYLGVDVSRTAVEIAGRKFLHSDSVRIIHLSEFVEGTRSELTLSLDVIFHLVEDDVYESYMDRLFSSSEKWVIIYSSDYEGSGGAPHVRHRKFSTWAEKNRSDFWLVEKIPNRYPFQSDDPENTSFADFFIFEKY